MGKPIPLEKVLRPHIRGVLLQWLKICKGIPPGHMVLVENKHPTTVEHALRQLVKKGLIPKGEYMKYVELWEYPKERRVHIIHLPRAKMEKERFLKELELRRSRRT